MFIASIAMFCFASLCEVSKVKGDSVPKTDFLIIFHEILVSMYRFLCK